MEITGVAVKGGQEVEGETEGENRMKTVCRLVRRTLIGIIREEGTTVEKMPSSEWPVGRSVAGAILRQVALAYVKTAS